MTSSLDQPSPQPESSCDSFTPTSVLTRSDLRGFILEELTATDRAVTTSELCFRASRAGYPAILVAAVYACLRVIERKGSIHRVASRGRLVYWAAAKAGNHPAAALDGRLPS